MSNKSLSKEYFEWLSDWVLDKRYIGRASYDKLLRYLHRKKFTWSLALDENRALDGMNLRYRFAGRDYKTIRGGECSILEMMVALSLRCEEDIMSDDEKGNRTARWFWEMIDNLGLESMYDDNFDKVYADEVIFRLLNREYEPDGTGGLFRVYDRGDLRKAEIWYQLMWYLDTII